MEAMAVCTLTVGSPEHVRMTCSGVGAVRTARTLFVKVEPVHPVLSPLWTTRLLRVIVILKSPIPLEVSVSFIH